MSGRQQYAVVILRDLRERSPFSPMIPFFQYLSRAMPSERMTTAEPQIDEEKQCGKCAAFRAGKNCLLMMERGQRVVGMCDMWNTTVMSDHGCTQHQKGEPGYL